MPDPSSPAARSTKGGTRLIQVWDLPTRLFHWLLVLLVAVGVVTGFVTPEWWMGVHMWAGYGVVALIIFRLVWGVFGPEYSRIASFAYGPRDVLGYGRGLLLLRPAHHIGHNPAGAVMIVLLAVVLIGVTTTGLLVLGGEEKQGPLAGVVTYVVGNRAKEIHEALVALLLVLIAAHVAGVVIHDILTGENLIRAMITGVKTLPVGAPVPKPRPARPGRAAATIGAILGTTGAALLLLSRLPPLGLHPLPDNPAHAEECGACHDAYHPSLLPAASWQALIADLGDHFGEDASLDDPVRQEILDFYVADAGRAGASEQPLRISELRWWVDEHREVRDAEWSRAKVKGNCTACHQQADQGIYEED